MHITSHDDMREAVQRVQQPTPAQARAGRYAMAHVIVGGLHITIETPMGGVRSGVGPKGDRWSVRMPADYGYLKRTEGADGDHVDVYVGPFSHGAEGLPVWIVDQCDADSRAFDEHKVMVGFPDSQHAKHTYMAAFSDGRGHERVGAVTQMSFEEFKNWLDTGNTTIPVAYKSNVGKNIVVKGVSGIIVKGPGTEKSDFSFSRYRVSAYRNTASAGYGASTCPCTACRGTHGGSMNAIVTPGTETVTGAKAASQVQSLSFVQKYLGKALAVMSPADRASMMQDAAVMASTELGKAGNMLSGGESHERIGIITDQWDGSPDDTATVAAVHGPGSSTVAAVPVGPSQSASGNGAESMERQYSRHATQSGVTEASNRLGRDIMGIRSAVKSVLTVLENYGTQIEVLKSSVAAPVLDQAAIDKSIGEAVTVAIAKAMTDMNQLIAKAIAKAVVAKAEDKKDDDDDEDAKESDGKPFAKADSEKEAEDDGGDTAKSDVLAAANFRLLAKSRLTWANRRAFKARDHIAEGNKDGASRSLMLAGVNISKAAEYAEAAKSIIDGGPATVAVLSEIGKAKTKLAAAQAENQTKWPESPVRQVGKSQDGAVTGSETAKAADGTDIDLKKAVEQISKAAEGMGMLTASVQDVMNAVVHRGGGTVSNGTQSAALPPVFALAKANVGEINTREAALVKMRDEGSISSDDLYAGRDVLTRVRMGMPEELVKAQMGRLPPAVQAALNGTSAAA